MGKFFTGTHRDRHFGDFWKIASKTSKKTMFALFVAWNLSFLVCIDSTVIVPIKRRAYFHFFGKMSLN